MRIEVGIPGQGTIFLNHKGLLCFYSRYFKAALSRDIVESKTHVVKLPEEDPKTYKLFEHWLYEVDLRKQGVYLHPWHPCEPPDFLPVIDLWLFAERREIPLLANNCIDALRDLIVRHWLLPTGQMPYIYSLTVPGSPLRRFTIDIMARIWCDGRTGRLEFLDFTGEIWEDLTRAQLSRPVELTRRAVDRMLTCKWHEHPTGEWCGGGWSDEGGEVTATMERLFCA